MDNDLIRHQNVTVKLANDIDTITDFQINEINFNISPYLDNCPAWAT